MFKLIVCLRKLPHLSRGDFLDYWLNTHGELVRRNAAALKIRRYIQHHNLDDPLNEAIRKSRDSPEPFDGVAELWWDSKAEWEAGAKSQEGRAAGKAIREDEKNFFDPAQSPMWVGEEKVLIDG